MDEARKIIVAGGSGLIGRALVERLVARGDDVVVLSRRPDAARIDGARTVAWDGRTAEPTWRNELAGAAGVVNLSGASIGGPRWTPRRKRLIVESRVAPTRALVEAIGKLDSISRPPVLVNASGIDYAGDTGDELVTEHAPPGTTFLARVCVEWERAALAADAHGTRVVVMRTSLVLARQARALRLQAAPFRVFAGGPLGSGRQWFPWIHLHDAVSLYRHALDERELVGPLDLVAPDLRRQRAVAEAIGRVLRRPSALPAPAAALRLLLGEQADLLLHGQRATSLKLDDVAFRYGQLEPALQEALG